MCYDNVVEPNSLARLMTVNTLRLSTVFFASLTTFFISSLALAQAPARVLEVGDINGWIGKAGDGNMIRLFVPSSSGWIGREHIYRLACVYLPYPSQQAPGKTSLQRLRELLPEGQQVVFEPAGVSREGRGAAVIYKDGKSIATQLVREGYAFVYPPDLETFDHCQFDLGIVTAMTTAKKERLGIWQQSNIVFPWNYTPIESDYARPPRTNFSIYTPPLTVNIDLWHQTRYRTYGGADHGDERAGTGPSVTSGSNRSGSAKKDPCRVPSDRASDGDRCGDTAASERPGGE